MAPPPRGTTRKQQKALAKALATREAEQRARAKRRWRILTPLIAVVVVAALMIVVAVAKSHKTDPHATEAAGSDLVSAVTGVPAAVYDEAPVVASSAPNQVLGSERAADAPDLLYVGADWCPFCAAERWVIADALSRFGDLSGFGTTASSATDVDPNTATLSFHGATFKSDTVKAVLREIEDGSGQQLDTLTDSEQQQFTSLGQGKFPFVDVGGKYLFSAQFDPKILAGMSHQQIADAMNDPKSSVGTTINGAANTLVAAICDVNGGEPAAVCTSKGVTAAAALLKQGQK